MTEGTLVTTLASYQLAYNILTSENKIVYASHSESLAQE